MRHWLTDRGSLTRRLKAHCSDFRVRPLATGLARPNADEHKLLLLRPGSLAYVREVLLSCHGKPVVFAHSVLPRSGLRGGWNGIARLGARPLGEALFNDHRIKRESLAYLRLSPHHALFHAASPHHAFGAPARGTPAGTPLPRSDPSAAPARGTPPDARPAGGLGAAQPMWARRSVFSLNGRPLLVTEVFLPGIEHL
jgi:chorismate--pyruvate lyase